MGTTGTELEVCGKVMSFVGGTCDSAQKLVFTKHVEPGTEHNGNLSHSQGKESSSLWRSTLPHRLKMEILS